ncbi:MAG: amino acid carrier protein, partial [Bacteriovoracaceae bacterium]
MESFLNEMFGAIVELVGSVLFYELPFIKFPFILAVMVMGGLFFTFRFGFINVRLFKHAIDVVRGRYDDPEHPGEITHFQALTSALSATVGLGNIAGVAVAIQLGGPGAVFWMWMVAFFGMSMKLSSCTFGQLYRDISDDGKVLGGPMVYLTKAFKEQLNLPKIGLVLGSFAAVATILGSFGGGNLFQANQTYELVANQFPFFDGKPFLVGGILSALVGIVILGGIKRIANVTAKLVPAMCLFYIACCLAIIFSNVGQVPSLFYDIIRQAFQPDAIYAGGFIGVLIQGVRRGAFSNEAGVGSAAIAHAAAKTDNPVREGVVAMIGPFIDTIVVCSMTALAILITEAHMVPELDGLGAQVTAHAF